jgi:acetyl esterase
MLLSKPIGVAMLAAACAGSGWAKSYQDVEYSRPEGQPLRFDATVPDGPGPFPAVIIVHGGGWVTGDKRTSVQPLFRPLTEGGFAWFSINYRLARGNNIESLVTLGTLTSLSSAVEDVRQAIAYIREHAVEYNIDPKRIGVIGESAGAHLALMAGLQPDPGADVQTVVAFYAPSDLVDLVKTSNRIPDQLRDMVKGTPLEALLLTGLQAISPKYFVRKDAPPMLLIHGTEDRLVPLEQSEEMCEAVEDAGGICKLQVIKGGGHGLRGWESSPERASYKTLLTSWLAEKLL